MIPQSGEIWRHYKGKDYLILDVGVHTETHELLVVYKALYPPYKTWIRPLKMWQEKVDFDGHYSVDRFTRIR